MSAEELGIWLNKHIDERSIFGREINMAMGGGGKAYSKK